MKDFSLIDKLKILMGLITSSSLFLILSVISILILILLIFCIIFNKKINKWIFIGIVIFVGSILFVNYASIIISILDQILDSIFMALYFPSFPIYISVLLMSNILFIVSIFGKKQPKIRRIVNIVQSLILNLFLILIIEVVSKNNINIYEPISLYTNSILLVLLQLSMGLFVSNILINLLISAKIKLKKYDIAEYPKMPEIIFD